MAKPMPIGVDDFAEARRKYYFVDKTKFISELWQQHGAATLITRPRRFGKTMTLSMLKYFFSEENAAENRKLFDGLEVSKDAAVMAEQGRRPVLFLTLKEWKFFDWETMQTGIREYLQILFSKYAFLLKSDCLTEVEQAAFQEILDNRASLTRQMAALGLLLHGMASYYKKRVVFLLDEYDVPVQYAWENGYYKQAVSFMRVFLTTVLKTNPDLDFAVLTGVLRIAKESIFSDLNNLQVSTLLNATYAEAMGFTEKEVRSIAEAYHAEDKLPEIKHWYDGYRFAGREIYNPWSVVNYFANGCKPGYYWLNTSGNSIVHELVKHADVRTQQKLLTVMNGGTISATLKEGLIYDDIAKDQDALYTMLLTTGYLTATQSQLSPFGYEAQLRIPNYEITSVYRNEIVQRFQPGIQISDLAILMRALCEGDAGTVQRGLSDYLEILASSFDTAAREAFYHGFVLGMTAFLVPEYDVRSNRESGVGRYDIAVFPKEKGKAGLILEFKTAENEDQLEQKATEAIEQIESRDYRAEFRAQGVETVYAYGIAFCGKQVTVKLQGL